MQFQITIPQLETVTSRDSINLIKTALEKSFRAVDIREASTAVTFDYQADVETTRIALDTIFDEILKPQGFEYTDLIKLDY